MQARLRGTQTDHGGWRAMEAHVSHVEVEGGAVAWSARGSGPPVVLIHGTLTSLDDSLIALGDAISSHGYRAVAFDRPGNGQSAGSALDGSMWAQARRLAAASRALGLERPLLVGHSQGGSVALAWATLFPESVAGVVAVSPIVLPEPRLEHLVFGPRAAVGTGDLLSYSIMPIDALLMPALWRGMFAPQPVPDTFSKAFPVDEAGERARLRRVGQEAMHLVPDLALLSASLVSCRVPVRVLQGDCDLVVNPAHGRVLAGLVPDGRFTQLPGLGHMAHHFAQAEIVGAIDSLFPVTGDRERATA